MPPPRVPPITNTEILSFLLSTSTSTHLIIRTSSPPTSATRVSQALHHRNINLQTYPSPDFHLETDTESGATNIVVVKDELPQLLKQSTGLRVKTVILTTLSEPEIHSSISQTHQDPSAIMIAQDDIKHEDIDPAMLEALLTKPLHLQSSDTTVEKLLSRDTVKHLLQSSEELLQSLLSSTPNLGQLPPCPPPPKPYVHRSLSPLNRLVTPELFTHNSDDIFLVRADPEDLRTHFKSRKLITIDTLENQTETITVKIITCSDDEQKAFNALTALTSAPVHLLQVTSTFQFDHLQSRGSTRLIDEYRDSRKNTVADERDLVSPSYTTFSSIPISIRAPMRSTGLRTLSTSIAHALVNVNSLVFKTTITDLILSLPSLSDSIEDNTEYNNSSAAEFASNELAQELLGINPEASSLITAILTSKDKPVFELLITGWEELTSRSVELALELVRHIHEHWTGVRLWIFTVDSTMPLSFNRALEEALGMMKSYLLASLTEEQQEEILKSEGPAIEAVATEIARALNSLSPQQQFTTSPLHVSVIMGLAAQLVEDEEKLFEGSRNVSDLLPPDPLLFMKVCAEVMEHYAAGASSEEFSIPHQYYAMKKLVPDTLPMIKTLYPAVKKMEVQDILRFGIIEGFYKNRTGYIAEFMHPCYAEYFAWKFTVEHQLTQGLDDSVSDLITDALDSKSPSLQGLEKLGRVMFAGWLGTAVQEKDLRAIAALIALDRDIVDLLVEYVSTKDMSFNCFKLWWSGIEGELGMGLKGVEGMGVFVAAVEAGNYSVIKFLTVERGYGAEFWERYGGVGRLLRVALGKVSESVDCDLEGREKIVKFLVFVDKGVVKKSLPSVFDDWKSACKEFEWKLVLTLEAEVGGVFKLVDAEGKSLVEGLGSLEATNKDDLQKIVKYLVEEKQFKSDSFPVTKDNVLVAEVIADEVNKGGDMEDAKVLYSKIIEMGEGVVVERVRGKMASLEPLALEGVHEVPVEKKRLTKREEPKPSPSANGQQVSKGKTPTDKSIEEAHRKKKRWFTGLC